MAKARKGEGVAYAEADDKEKHHRLHEAVEAINAGRFQGKVSITLSTPTSDDVRVADEISGCLTRDA